MIASWKSYSRIARVLLGVLGALLIGGIVGSMLMGVRAKRTAQDMVVAQAGAIADSSLSLLFQPSDLTGVVNPNRAAQLTDQIQRVIVDPSDFDTVTVFSPEGTIVYSNEQGRIGTQLSGEKDRIKDALKGTPQVTTYQGNVSVMLPLTFPSGVGPDVVVQLTRSNQPIATAAGPWNTNAMFLFAALIVLVLAVFGVARLSAATRPEETQPAAQTIVRETTPSPVMREEKEARRRAEQRAVAAEDRLSLLQDQYRKALEELQDYRELATDPHVADAEVEARALRAEGQVRTLERTVDTLTSERVKLSEQLQEALRQPVTLDDGRVEALEAEAAALREELREARGELRQAQVRAERTTDGDDDELRQELDATHVELLRAKDDLDANSATLERARRELDDARIELRALRAEEQRAAMLDDELRATKAELDSRNASFRAELVEREAEFEAKVRETRESFQQQLAAAEASYGAQLRQAEEALAGRIDTAEADARRAAAELESARADMDTLRQDLDAARGEAEAREQRLLEAHDEIVRARQQVKDLEHEMKERTAAVTQAHKEADDVRRALVGAQADLSRVDDSVEELRAEIEAARERADAAEETANVEARERVALQDRIEKLVRQLDDAAADNQELNRRLQDFEARRQLELADDQGRTQIDELLRVTQERLAGQTEKLIAAEDRVHELEAEMKTAGERAEVAEAEIRQHQMSEALREMREHDVAANRDPQTQRDISAATSAAIEVGALEDRRSTSPYLKELSLDAKRSIAKIDGISKLLKHRRDGKDQAQLMRQLATYTRRLDYTVADLADAEKLANGTVELQVKRTDMQPLIARVVEESGDTDHDIRVVAETLRVRIDPMRTERIVASLLRVAIERTQNGKTIVVRLQQTDGGAIVSVEGPGDPAEALISPVVRRFAEIQGGWIKAEATEGGNALRVYLPDGAGEDMSDAPSPALQITVEAIEPDVDDTWEAESAHQELAAELRRFAQMESDSKR
jgi:predicted  nucleic acid-binding Zn-ribbon protein